MKKHGYTRAQMAEMNKVPPMERVAQSANADVREVDIEFALSAKTPQEAFDLGRAFERALPVPVGDETEALAEAAVANELSVRKQLIAVEARVAGLEAREALLREELRLREESQIPVVPRAAQEKIERLEAREASLRALLAEAVDAVWDSEWFELRPRIRAALADSGEAGS